MYSNINVLAPWKKLMHSQCHSPPENMVLSTAYMKAYKNLKSFSSEEH
jgi:hypothetical protein